MIKTTLRLTLTSDLIQSEAGVTVIDIDQEEAKKLYWELQDALNFKDEERPVSEYKILNDNIFGPKFTDTIGKKFGLGEE